MKIGDKYIITQSHKNYSALDKGMIGEVDTLEENGFWINFGITYFFSYVMEDNNVKIESINKLREEKLKRVLK